MKWKKLGCIVPPQPDLPWLENKAGSCFVTVPDERTFRLFVSGRDHSNVSRIGLVDVDRDSLAIRQIHEEPILDIGDIGTFDESGVCYPWIVSSEGTDYLYYTGFIAGTKAGYKNAVGLATGSLESGFTRYSQAPILPLTREEPFDTGSVAVLIENGLWKMYYTGFDKREAVRVNYKSFYKIKYATSKDGISWERPGVTCIDYKDDKEFAIARPMVLKEDGSYKMWFSYSAGAYRIGYAESEDGIRWNRSDDRGGLLPSASGWDSEMVEYAFVLRLDRRYYMFYNGNSFGGTGLGLAVSEEVSDEDE